MPPTPATSRAAAGPASQPDRRPIEASVPRSSTAPTADEHSSWLASEPLQLREGLEQVDGLDGRTLLHDPATGRYVAVSETGLALISALDGRLTGDQVLAKVAGGRAAAAAPAVRRFLIDLRQSGVLTLDPAHESRRHRLVRRSMRQRMPRLRLTRSARVVAAPLGRWLARVEPRALSVLAVAIALGCVGFGLWAELGHHFVPMSWWAFLAFPVLIIQIATHELGHAVVCQMIGHPVREAGITLLLWVMPVAYVDRTDTYRVPARAPRVLVSVAGPMVDTVWMAATAVVCLTATGPAYDAAATLLHLQLLLLIMNVNPLLPSDGYHALESAIGATNFRGRAMAYVTHLVFRGRLTSGLASATSRQRVAMAIFAVLCLAYGAFVIWYVLRYWISLAQVLL